MKCEIEKLSKTGIVVILLVTILAFFAGCAPNAAVKLADKGLTPSTDPKRITDISTAEDSGSVVVIVKGNQPLTYTSVKQPSPLGVILYFPETNLDIGKTVSTPDNDVVNSITSSQLIEQGNASRIEITLKKDVAYDVVREDTGLKISFRKEAQSQKEDVSATDVEKIKAEKSHDIFDSDEKPTEKILPAATRLQTVDAKQLNDRVRIAVMGNGTITEYKSFTIDNPPRIIFDIFNVKSAIDEEQKLAVDSKSVKQIHQYIYPDRVRLILDTEDSYLSSFTSTPVENGLLIEVDQATGPALAADVPVNVTKEQKPVSRSQFTKPVVSKQPVRSEMAPAWVNRIDFSSEKAGRSTVIIGTTRPIDYKIEKAADKRLQLKLFNTGVPDYRQRALITTRFESAVDRVLPMQKPVMGNHSVISIEMRESVPYYVEQTDNVLLVHFEPSSIPPRPFEMANLPPWQQILAQTTGEPMLSQGSGTSVRTERKPIAQAPGVNMGGQEPKTIFDDQTLHPETTKKYIGEKITLDFFETDIKNVFRIIREISGKNFAIDKDVSGKVTLTFDKPVPWDQVLDLVLKMNQLGMVIEGEIIRIATLGTIRREEKQARDKLLAEKKAREQKVALEPLVTEYIAVNYSNAKSEILPHIQTILTEGRGSISVDERNNQLIITDVVDKIAQAREIVQKIDKVTPQVIIEARIVEVNEDFSKDIGIQWDLTYGPVFRDSLNGEYTTDFAMNYPAATDNGIGFNFMKLTGTPIVLNARLTALETKGEGRIISAPKIVTLDNKKARIKQGIEYPYLERDDTGGSSVKFKDIDLLLEVTPHVTPDNRVSMSIFITKNDIDAIFQGVPSLSTNEAETELLVNEGDTIVIGGIIKTSANRSKDGFPMLHDVPGLGWLFGRKIDSANKNELLIFITPRIVQLEQRTT
jgi:type IV pilus assembly protein PilQ